MAAGVDIDGRWYDDVGGTSLVSGELVFSSDDDVEQHAVRRGFRGSKYVIEYNHPAANEDYNGVLLHYQDPENFMALVIRKRLIGTYAKLIRRKDGDYSQISLNSSPFIINDGDPVRVAIHDDPNDADLQEVELYVNGVSKFTSTAIDDDWSGGMTGFNGGKLKQMQQAGLHVELDDMGMVESVHACAVHWVIDDLHARINGLGRYGG